MDEVWEIRKWESQSNVLLLQSPFVQYLSKKHYNQMKLFVKLQEVAFFLSFFFFFFLKKYKATPVLQKKKTLKVAELQINMGAISYAPFITADIGKKRDIKRSR